MRRLAVLGAGAAGLYALVVRGALTVDLGVAAPLAETRAEAERRAS